MEGVQANPRMTREIVRRRLFADNKTVILDVGAREATHKHWEMFAPDLLIIGFEPDPVEYEKLQAERNDAIYRFFQVALGSKAESREFFLTRLSAASGLYKNVELFGRVENGQNVAVVNHTQIETIDFDTFAAANEIRDVDFVKLDVEGAELEILEGASQLLSNGNVLGVELEVRFPKKPASAPCFAEIDQFLRKHGFFLYDFDIYRYARADLPMPPIWDYRDLQGHPYPGPTTSGQILSGDAVYFRDLAAINSTHLDSADRIRMLKLACLFEIYGLADCAVELLLSHKEEIEKSCSVDLLLNLLTPQIGNRSFTYEEYLRYAVRYNSDENRIVGMNPYRLRELLSESLERQSPDPLPDSIQLARLFRSIIRRRFPRLTQFYRSVRYAK